VFLFFLLFLIKRIKWNNQSIVSFFVEKIISMASSATPKLIIPDEKSTNETSGSTHSSFTSSTSVISTSSGTATKKLTKILSTQSSFDRHHPPHPVRKRFSIDADPSSIILNTPVTDLSNNPLQQPSSLDIDDNSSTTNHGKDPSPARSPSLKKSDSFLEIPYEKGEIVDLIKLADDPNAAAHVTSDGNEVLLEHGAAPQ
jgi:hypothetical protein